MSEKARTKHIDYHIYMNVHRNKKVKGLELHCGEKRGIWQRFCSDHGRTKLDAVGGSRLITSKLTITHAYRLHIHIYAMRIYCPVLLRRDVVRAGTRHSVYIYGMLQVCIILFSDVQVPYAECFCFET